MTRILLLENPALPMHLNSQTLGPKTLGPQAVPADGVGLIAQQVDHAPAELEELRLRADRR